MSLKKNITKRENFFDGQSKLFILERFSSVIYFSQLLHENKNKFYKEKESRLVDELFFEESFRLDERYHKILRILFIERTAGIKQIGKKIDPDLTKNKSRVISRQIKDLIKLGLVEEDHRPEEDSIFFGRTKKILVPVELSQVGLFYIVYNHKLDDFVTLDIYKTIIDKYWHYYLFEFFLRPFFSDETTLELDNLGLGRIIVDYLNRICHIINENLVWAFAHSYNGLFDDEYVPIFLFNWYNEGSDNKYPNDKTIQILKSYLYKELKWEWIHQARMKFNYSDNTIDILGDNDNYAIVLISVSSKQVILRHKGTTYSNLFRMIEMNNAVSICGKYKPIKELVEPPFLFQCKQALISLLFVLQSFAINNDKIRQALSNDTNYRKILEEMKNTLEFKE